jgi:ankyrin repeat protein
MEAVVYFYNQHTNCIKRNNQTINNLFEGSPLKSYIENQNKELEEQLQYGLMWACKLGYTDIVKYLVCNGVTYPDAKYYLEFIPNHGIIEKAKKRIMKIIK